jgi:hypothetical protein
VKEAAHWTSEKSERNHKEELFCKQLGKYCSFSSASKTCGVNHIAVPSPYSGSTSATMEAYRKIETHIWIYTKDIKEVSNSKLCFDCCLAHQQNLMLYVYFVHSVPIPLSFSFSFSFWWFLFFRPCGLLLASSMAASSSYFQNCSRNSVCRLICNLSLQVDV